MAQIPVDFVYYTSIPGWPTASVTAELRGSWNVNGRFSEQWTSSGMTRNIGVDGCLCFKTTVELDATEIGRTFEWGVAFKDGARESWAIATEVKETPDEGIETASRRLHRVFRFSGDPQVETYFLTHCRRLGANRRIIGTAHDAIQFSVWAPNAQSVELVAGIVFEQANQGKTVPENAIERNKLCGGFISDSGDGISATPAPVALQRGREGVWETDLAEDALSNFKHWDHRPYMYRIVRSDNSTVYRTDLYSRCQVGYGAEGPAINQPYTGPLSGLEGRLSCSAVVDPETVVEQFEENPVVFPERVFITEAKFWANEFTGPALPTRVEDLVIYELHMGALGTDHSTPGSLQDALDMLDHIVDAGANAVELLPLSEFGGGAQNWGYATSHYFAIEYGGGGRDQFKHFVKTCHQRGLAVIMDVVYNHYDQDADRAERGYDSPDPERDIYYWYEGVPSDYSYPRGGYIDNWSTGDAPAYHEEMVRKMFISSAVTLLREFHVDGLRVDQTTSIHGYNRRRSDGSLIYAANNFGAKLLRELGRTLRLVKPGVLLVAEDHSTWDEVTLPVENGGMGFDARWYSGFYHCLQGDTDDGNNAKLIHTAAANAFSHPSLRIDSFGAALAATGDAKVVYSESHDEAGNSKGPFYDASWSDKDDKDKQYTSHRGLVVAANAWPLVGDTRRYAEARCRFAYGVTIFSAGTPMFLFGEEVGAENRFKYNKVLENKEDYRGMRTGSGKNLFSYYSAANALRRRWAGLRSRNIDIVHVHNDNRILAFRRWEGTEHYLIVSSLSDVSYSSGYHFQNVRIWDGIWQEIFNSDSHLFGGDNVGNFGTLNRIAAGEVTCNIPANGLIIFQRISE